MNEKSNFESAIFGVFKFLFNPIVPISGICIVLYGVQSGAMGGFLGVAFASIMGVVAGFGLSFKLIDHCVIHHPGSIMKTFMAWKNDGRWDKMVDSIHQRRKNSSL